MKKKNSFPNFVEVRDKIKLWNVINFGPLNQREFILLGKRQKNEEEDKLTVPKDD